MCQDCGCGDPELVPVEVQKRILSQNDETAGHNREHFMDAGILALNLMGSPGAGKTAVLEATAKALKGRLKLGAVSGDLATDNDAVRLEAAGIPSGCITTGQSCHLDARLVHEAMHDFPMEGLQVFVIENVGNLVCPAIYDLGQAANVVALSVTEGEDKPIKYPVMFQKADLVLLTKADLIPHLDISVEKIRDSLSRVMPVPRLIEVSAKTGKGIDQWIAWVEERREQVLAAMAHAPKGAHMPSHSHPHSHAGGETHEHDHEHDAAHDHAHPHVGAHGPAPKLGGHGHSHGPGDHGHHHHGAGGKGFARPFKHGNTRGR